MRSIKGLSAAVAALALTSCAGDRNIDLCRGAEVRRTAYTATITVAEGWEASGRVVPYQVTAARTAAFAALAVLNSHCPAVAQ